MTRKRSIYAPYAPTCVLPGCDNRVSYHDIVTKSDGTPGIHWKACCELHRNENKDESDTYKLSRGCENKDGRLGLGFSCESIAITEPSKLDYDHWNGNRFDQSEDNIVVLCKDCHSKKSVICKDNLNRYSYVNPNFNDFFELV